jgi:arabinogalactan endo-1,4-beta-galactosidase
MGVDASMVAEIEALGGKYYNQAVKNRTSFKSWLATA